MMTSIERKLNEVFKRTIAKAKHEGTCEFQSKGYELKDIFYDRIENHTSVEWSKKYQDWLKKLLDKKLGKE